MAIHEDDKREELDQVEKEIAEARRSTSDRSDKVDDLSIRLRELRRRNHFRLMLEEIFSE
jgi:hypothetical protein